MSQIPPPTTTGLIQTAQAQQSAAKARSKERQDETRKARDDEDTIDLRVADLESDDAVRALPQNDSEEAGQEHRSRVIPSPKSNDDDPEQIERVDVRA